jgi:hypothetical protein
VKHIDSEIIVAAFIPDEQDRQQKNDVICVSFLNQVMAKEPNTRLRVSFTALGEFFYVYARRRNHTQVHLDGFLDFCTRMGKRFEPYSPELKGPTGKLHEALKSTGDCCETGKKSHADALISAYAMVDSEAVSLYTLDRHMLSCPVLHDRIDEFRKANELGRLRIRPI